MRGIALAVLAGVVSVPVAARAEAEAPLYGPEQAVEDILSGPLEYIGRGNWHGIFRLTSCGYRNERVIVIDVYCTRREFNSFSVQVFSPTHGYMRIYAEASAPIIQVERADYMGWSVETRPVDPKVGPIDLDSGFARANEYAERHYKAYLPGCYATTNAGHQRHKGLTPGTGYRCLRADSRVAEWTDLVASFYEHPPKSWYRLIKVLRQKARRRGGGGHKVDGNPPASSEDRPRKK